MLCNSECCVLQLYTDRLKIVKSEKERDLWSSIDFNFMTEESEHENEDIRSGTTIVRRSLTWRSKSMLLYFKTKHVLVKGQGIATYLVNGYCISYHE